MPDFLQFYILCVHDFNILKKKICRLTMCRLGNFLLSSKRVFFLEKFDRERKIH